MTTEASEPQLVSGGTIYDWEQPWLYERPVFEQQAFDDPEPEGPVPVEPVPLQRRGRVGRVVVTAAALGAAFVSGVGYGYAVYLARDNMTSDPTEEAAPEPPTSALPAEAPAHLDCSPDTLADQSYSPVPLDLARRLVAKTEFGLAHDTYLQARSSVMDAPDFIGIETALDQAMAPFDIDFHINQLPSGSVAGQDQSTVTLESAQEGGLAVLRALSRIPASQLELTEGFDAYLVGYPTLNHNGVGGFAGSNEVVISISDPPEATEQYATHEILHEFDESACLGGNLNVEGNDLLAPLNPADFAYSEDEAAKLRALELGYTISEHAAKNEEEDVAETATELFAGAYHQDMGGLFGRELIARKANQIVAFHAQVEPASAALYTYLAHTGGMAFPREVAEASIAPGSLTTECFGLPEQPGWHIEAARAISDFVGDYHWREYGKVLRPDGSSTTEYQLRMGLPAERGSFNAITDAARDAGFADHDGVVRFPRGGVPDVIHWVGGVPCAEGVVVVDRAPPAIRRLERS